MTTLRQKLIDEIQLRGFSPHTQDSYVRWGTGLARFRHRSPDQIGDDEIKAYLLHLLRIRKLAVSSLIVAVSALRFFFGQVLHHPTQAIEEALPHMKKPILRPKVYSVQELERLWGRPNEHARSSVREPREFPARCRRSTMKPSSLRPFRSHRSPSRRGSWRKWSGG